MGGSEGFAVTTNDVEMLRLVEHARSVAVTRYPVLIQGETGTGKEVFARGIHSTSARTGPFVPIDCGAIPEALFEAELFGAERGSYTGQSGERRGLVRVAHLGTLFLDEIAEMPLASQAKMLRVLQDGEVRPLGASTSQRVEVRIIAATHRNISGLVREGRFREDLYFRISAACINLPPIRDRGRDLDLLFEVALQEAAHELGREVPSVDPEVMDMVRRYRWPGNVRELKHIVAAAMMTAPGDTLGAEQFALLRERFAVDGAIESPSDKPFFEALAGFEHAYMKDLLERTGYNISRAAELSKLSRATVRTKARHHCLLEGNERKPGRPRRRVRGVR